MFNVALKLTTVNMDLLVAKTSLLSVKNATMREKKTAQLRRTTYQKIIPITNCYTVSMVIEIQVVIG